MLSAPIMRSAGRSELDVWRVPTRPRCNHVRSCLQNSEHVLDRFMECAVLLATQQTCVPPADDTNAFFLVNVLSLRTFHAWKR